MQVQRVEFLPLFNLRAMPFEFSTVEWSAVHKNKSSTVQNSTVGQSVIHHCVGESISALEKEEEREQSKGL